MTQGFRFVPVVIVYNVWTRFLMNTSSVPHTTQGFRFVFMVIVNEVRLGTSMTQGFRFVSMVIVY